MRIESVASQPDMAGRFRVCFSDDSVMRLYKQTVQDFGIYPGRELTQQEYQELQSAAKKMSAKMRAVRIISASSVSKKDLEQRLLQKGEDAASTQEAIRWLQDMDLLDDRKTAELVVSRCIGKGYGLQRAKQALYEKRIPKEYWDEVLADYPDQSDAIRAYIENHLPPEADTKAVKKVVDALLRRGHSYGQIRSVLSDREILED